ncbi:TPA: hypothetical protein ACGO62_001936 [Streptococcus suis]
MYGQKGELLGVALAPIPSPAYLTFISHGLDQFYPLFSTSPFPNEKPAAGRHFLDRHLIHSLFQRQYQKENTNFL